jgi:hypothetical protein
MQFIVLIGLIFLAAFCFYWGLAPIDAGWAFVALENGDLLWQESARPFWYAATIFRVAILLWGVLTWSRGWTSRMLACSAAIGLVLALWSYPYSGARVRLSSEGVEWESQAERSDASLRILWSEIESVGLVQSDRTSIERSKRRRYRVYRRTFRHTDLIARSKGQSVTLPIQELEEMEWFFRLIRPNFGFSAKQDAQQKLMAYMEQRLPVGAQRNEAWIAARAGNLEIVARPK